MSNTASRAREAVCQAWRSLGATGSARMVSDGFPPAYGGGPCASAERATIHAMADPDFGHDPGYEERLARVSVGDPEALSRPIELRDYDSRWHERFARQAADVRRALGGRAVRVEHVGSTAVPGLPAKPIIDMVLEVADSSDEPAYVPALESAGYILRIREPEWFEHRLLRRPEPAVNLHVFSAGCLETGRMVRFRDHLRDNAADRELYAQAKRVLAARRWRYMQQYADAKSDVVEAIIARAAQRTP